MAGKSPADMAEFRKIPRFELRNKPFYEHPVTETSASIGAWERNFPPFKIIMANRQPTNRQTDWVRKVLLPIIMV